MVVDDNGDMNCDTNGGATVLNLAGYRFVSLDGLAELRERLHAAATAQALRGTVLLAPEGINLFLAGCEARLAGIGFKRSHSAAQPFRKLLVKIKPEIITLRVPDLNPSENPAPAVAPRELKRWLDQGHDDAGREVVLLDTRNRWEVDQGSFTNAVHPDLEKFSDYPLRVGALGDLAGKTIVTFCTGGIRCEKAAPWMRRAGYDHVYQLQGGILQYFEDCGGAHYQGECVVFDARGSLDADLMPARRVST